MQRVALLERPAETVGQQLRDRRLAASGNAHNDEDNRSNYRVIGVGHTPDYHTG
jgi:hypothetical protein